MSMICSAPGSLSVSSHDANSLSSSGVGTLPKASPVTSKPAYTAKPRSHSSYGFGVPSDYEDAERRGSGPYGHHNGHHQPTSHGSVTHLYDRRESSEAPR